MEMSIEKTMNELKTQIRYYKDFWGADASDYVIDAFNTAISTMRKYQKIVEIVNSHPEYIHHTDMNTYKVNSIREVIEDGNGVSNVRI